MGHPWERILAEAEKYAMQRDGLNALAGEGQSDLSSRIGTMVSIDPVAPIVFTLCKLVTSSLVMETSAGVISEQYIYDG